MANKLVLQLLADSNGLIKGLNEAQRSVDRFVQAAGGAGTAIGGPVNQALAAFAGLAKGGASAAGILAGGLVAAATAATALTLRAGQQVEAIDHLSQKTGIAIQTIQRWSVVMAENNFQAESLTASMRTLSKFVTEARNPASDAAATFEEMGISLTQLGSTEDVIRAVADKFASMPDGVDKARLAVTLFGKAGLELIPVLNRGAAAFDESAKASERFGVVLTTQQIAALEAADDASDRLSVALQGLSHQLAATFAPTVASGITMITEAVASLTRITQNYSAALEQIKKDHPIISSLSPGIASAMAAAKASQMPAPSGGGGGGVPGAPMDSHVASFAATAGARQEQLGRAILARNLTMIQQNAAAGKSEERRGADIVRSTQIAVRALEEEEAVRLRSEGAYQAFLAHRIIEESQAAQKAEGNYQEYLGRKIVMEEQANQLAEGRNQEHLGQFIVDQALAAEKMRSSWVISAEQMQQSLAHSFGQIRTQFGNTITNVILGTGQLSDIWKGFAALTLNTFIQLGLQMVANWAATQGAMIAGSSISAATIGSIFSGLAAGIIGAFGAITGAIQGLFTSVLIPAFIKIGAALMAFLSALAEAATATIFGIPYAVAILAGVAVIGAAIGTLAAFAFKDGGIATGPMMGMVGEAGSSEAVIPLNKRGAAFMRETLGLGGQGTGQQTIILELDSRVLSKSVSRGMPSVLRLAGLKP